MARTSDVIKISIQDIIDYCTCPLKFGQAKKGSNRMTGHDLFIKSARAGVHAYYNAVAQGYSIPAAIARATKKFDIIWLEHYKDVVQDNRMTTYKGWLLAERIASTHNNSEDEVVAVNFPIEVALSSKIIVTDTIDVLIINQKHRSKGGKKIIRGISFVDLDQDDNERLLDVRASLMKTAIQRYLGTQTRRNYTYEVRPFMGKDLVIEPKSHQHRNLLRLAGNVSKSIRQEIWYPTTSKETCKRCHLNKTCNLSLL